MNVWPFTLLKMPKTTPMTNQTVCTSSFCCVFNSECFQDFYNYFQHGLDFFISGSTHTVKKIIIHSNIASSIPLSEIHQSNGTKTAWISTLPTVQAMQLGNRRRTRRRRRRSVFQNSMFHLKCWLLDRHTSTQTILRSVRNHQSFP